jgi:intracellular septation protein A
MRKWMFSFFVAVQLLLMPVLAFGKPNCSSLPWQAQAHNPNCVVAAQGWSLNWKWSSFFSSPKPHCANCVVAMPEHWGTFESFGFFALVLIAFWVMVHLRILHLNKRA